MKKLTQILFALLIAVTASAADIVVEHLDHSHSLVRINPDAAKYLIMPVQESIDDARVNVIVDGKLDKTFYVRLARTDVDYTVPFDLTPYKGHKLILSVDVKQNKSHTLQTEFDICWNSMALADTFSTQNREKYRPAYHHTPQYGWMNDPNGMFYANGVWHLYYQYNPYGSRWQNMTWGHSSSRDLIHWERHPLAIEPDVLGTIFSGSCAIDSLNTAGFGKNSIVAMFTSADACQVQSLAHSTNGGESFVKYPGNPVITMDTEARDPNFFFDSTSGEWKLVLAHALEKEIVFFSSPDLKKWTYTGAFGKGLGAQGGVWECPDIFRLPVAGTDEYKWVLLCNINPGGPFGGSATQYFIGEFDGKSFHADTDADGKVPVKWLDHGKDYYATVTWSNAPAARRTSIGWMSNWQYAADVPTTQFRSANSLPRDIQLFRADDGQIYAASAPAPELDELKGKLVAQASNISVGENTRSYILPESGIAVIDIDLDCSNAARTQIVLSNNLGEKVVLNYKTATDLLSFDRAKSGKTEFSHHFAATTKGKAFSSHGHLSLRLFIDRSSIELFANGGRLTMTNLVFPSSPYSTITVSNKGGNTRIENIKIHDIKL